MHPNFSTLYQRFIPLLSYPRTEYLSEIDLCVTLVREETENSNLNAAALKSIESFKQLFTGKTIGELEELYTQTFEINPVSCLEIGWHLYGEQYERGAFLVHLRGLLRNYSIEESSELPDHVTHILALLAVMDAESANALRTGFLLAFEKVLDGFNGKENPYEHLIRSLHMIVQEQQSLMNVKASELAGSNI